MRKIISLVLSLLLVSQSALIYAQGAPSAGNIDYSIYKDMMIDGSFYNIPRSSRMMVDSECAGDMEQKRLCDEFIATHNPTLCADPACARKYIKCTKVYGAYNHNPESICLQYYKYGVDRAQAWHAYVRAKWEEDGAYYNLSPIEIYEKYEQVVKDIAHLWNINPEYVKAKRDKNIIRVVTTIGILVVAIYVGQNLAPLLQSQGLNMTAHVASVLPLETAAGAAKSSGILIRIISVLKTGRFWADLGLSLVYMYMDVMFADSTFAVMFDLYDGLYSMQSHVNVDLALHYRDLLAEIVLPVREMSNKKNEIEAKIIEGEEVAGLSQELKEEVKKSIETHGWGDNEKVQKEAVVTLYALEYIRAEMADMSDPERYREAAVDVAQIYFSGNQTNLDPEREKIFFLVAEAHAAAAKNEKYDLQQKILKYALGDKWVVPYALKYHFDSKRDQQGDQNEND